MPHDPAVALSWYQKSAAANDPIGLYDLGKAYRDGAGVPQDYAKAAELYRKMTSK